MEQSPLNRRDFNKLTVAAVSGALSTSQRSNADENAATRKQPYNIVMVMADQESYHLNQPAGYELPSRAELSRRGTTFENHYIAAAMCTPSRGVLFSGRPPQINGVFDQMELGYVPSLNKDKPSMGTVMKALGYTTAYFGKFELRRDIIYPKDTINYTTALTEYGFDTFAPDGDKIGAPNQGYDTDNYTVIEGTRWLRTNAHQLNREGKPWFLLTSMVSPHDIMYANGNLPGEKVQVSQAGAELTHPPQNSLYQYPWRFPLSPSRLQPVKPPARPDAQLQYLEGWSYWLGTIPADRTEMWRIFYNYYLNLIRDNDRMLQSLLTTCDELDLWKNTIFIFTADHGELGGSHGGLRGKGPFPFEQQSHVPFIIVHPDHQGGRSCTAVTSHIDLLPTLASLTEQPLDARKKATQGMPGKDISVLLENPEAAAADAIRKGALFNYVGLQTIDANYLKKIAPLQAHSKFVPPLKELHPNLKKRGFLNFVFDGRYKYARYYAPSEFNMPETLEQIYQYNDLELFDLYCDPHEMNNLAMEPEANRELILRLNGLMNELMMQEVGVHDGQFLPAAVRPKGPIKF
ncbi:Arylsulfatase precursor [Gimesia alba]|uniref:Arylsulfatase n=1 Tax=Gimesia alba TaxID=2527973 RepID=A0A517RKT2_9PLAN|nr:sulfatase-like hydrolase/transferase [Gimesia alba]QDT44490.1 Arylsulfatase precursor [Gimesia alba]